VDDEEAVTATLNTLQGKGKQAMEDGEGPSSRLKKKKKKNDKRCHDNNLVMAAERKATRPKNNPPKNGPPKDHFERLSEVPCTHHKVPVKHALKDCRLMKNYVTNMLKPKTTNPPKKVVPPPNNDDDEEGVGYPGDDNAVHMIFGGTPARP
jgi:hypothetical protein